jgi:hypothetical protein
MAEETTVTKPRKKKAAARWAMLEQLAPIEAREQADSKEELFRIVVDNCKSEKVANEAGAECKCSGRVLLVCIHRDGTATPKTQSEIVWKK